MKNDENQLYRQNLRQILELHGQGRDLTVINLPGLNCKNGKGYASVFF